MTLKTPLYVLFLVASAVGLGSCSNQDIGGDLIDVGVTDGGIILETSAQSCVDKSAAVSPQPRSLSKPAMVINGFSVIWKSKTLALFIGEIKVTVTSKKLTGGSFVVDLDAGEVEALLGALDAQLPPEPTGYKLYTSTSSTKPTSSGGIHLAACGLGIGGLTLVDPNSTQSFTARVKIDLIGTASDPAHADVTPQTVRKTITTTATYY
jgi:hypothetical protein